MKSHSFMMAMKIARQYQQQSTTFVFFDSYSVLTQKMKKGYSSKSTFNDLERSATQFGDDIKEFIKNAVNDGTTELKTVTEAEFNKFQERAKDEIKNKTEEFAKEIQITLGEIRKTKEELKEEGAELKKEFTKIADEAANRKEDINKIKTSLDNFKIGVAIAWGVSFFTQFLIPVGMEALKEKWTRDFTQEKLLLEIKKRKYEIERLKEEYDSKWFWDFEERKKLAKKINSLKLEQESLFKSINQPRESAKSSLKDIESAYARDSVFANF